MVVLGRDNRKGLANKEIDVIKNTKATKLTSNNLIKTLDIQLEKTKKTIASIKQLKSRLDRIVNVLPDNNTIKISVNGQTVTVKHSSYRLIVQNDVDFITKQLNINLERLIELNKITK